MARTTAERLELVRLAIDEILLTGQSVAYEGKSLSMPDLNGLRALEKELMERLGSEQAASSSSSVGRNQIIYVEPQ